MNCSECAKACALHGKSPYLSFKAGADLELFRRDSAAIQFIILFCLLICVNAGREGGDVPPSNAFLIRPFAVQVLSSRA